MKGAKRDFDVAVAKAQRFVHHHKVTAAKTHGVHFNGGSTISQQFSSPKPRVEGVQGPRWQWPKPRVIAVPNRGHA
jgi:hypothetical protein